MNQSKCKIWSLLLIFGFLCNQASAKEFKKTISEKYKIEATGKVDLSNQQGKIEVITWEKNQVKVDVVITVNARNQTDADEVFDIIQIDFLHFEDWVSVKTEIETLKSNWGWHQVSSKYTIDYQVFMPRSCHLNLFNKYGDAVIAELDGKANLTVQHGNIRLTTVESLLKLKLKYGNCTVAQVKNSEIDMEHGNIHMRAANNINLLTKYSKVNVDRANSIKCNSKNDVYKLGVIQEFNNQGIYDDIQIQEVKRIVVVSQFSDYSIGVIEKSADFDMTYGGVTISEVVNGFSEVLMTGKNTDFQIQVAKGTAYQLDAASRNAGIHFPNALKVIRHYNEGTTQKVKAYSGKNPQPVSYIKARVNYGDLSVK